MWGSLRVEGGRSGIRTHERVAPLTVFKTVAFVRSAILPGACYLRERLRPLERRASLPTAANIPCGWREYRAYIERSDELHRGEWLSIEERITELLDSDDGRSLFV